MHLKNGKSDNNFFIKILTANVKQAFSAAKENLVFSDDGYLKNGKIWQ